MNSNTLVKSYKNKKNGNLLEIHIEEQPENPREWDNLGEMLCCHNRYSLGDRHFKSDEDLEEYIEDEAIILKLPLYLYDHSGITMKIGSFSDPWDSGQVGWIILTREKFCREYKTLKVTKKRLKEAEKVLRAEVEIYDKYITGDIYGYIEYEISECDHDEEHKKHVDSCWGYFGTEGIDQILKENKAEEWVEI